MTDDRGSELHRALLHRTTCTLKHPAILQHIMKQLQAPSSLHSLRARAHLFLIISMLLGQRQTLHLHLGQS